MIFEILINDDISSLSNEFCKYYHVGDSEFFAIVFNKTYLAHINIIEKLKN